MVADFQHLQRYASTGDPHAFRELVRAHGAMVHATALRVTKNEAAAHDVAQEAFLELARKAGSITQSVALWLHRVAWNRACDVVRRDHSRRQAEEAMAETWHTDREATWPDIEPHVDASLNELPNELREVLVLYFLEGRTQAEVARHLGKNQATVSRAIDRGISAMREALRSRGVIAGAGLAALFVAQSAQAMPVAVQVSLGKLSLTGIGTSSAIPAASVTTTLVSMTATTKALLVTGTLAAVALPFVLHRRENNPAPVDRPSVAKSSAAKPKAKTPEMSDEELFNHLFGSGSERLKNARTLVDDYRAAHPGLSLTELAKDPALTPKLQSLMHDMMTTSGLGTEFADAIQLAMQVKGIKPSPGTNVNVNMSEGFLNTESQAERYLGAVLANDAKALAQLFADVVNEAAAEMALDPRVDKSSSGVSINNAPPPPGAKTPPPPGAKILQKEPED